MQPAPKAAPAAPTQPAPKESPAEPLKPSARSLPVYLNNELLFLPPKESGLPYYLMDLLSRSGIDFDHLERDVELLVNQHTCSFTQVLQPYDQVIIRYSNPL